MVNKNEGVLLKNWNISLHVTEPTTKKEYYRIPDSFNL